MYVKQECRLFGLHFEPMCYESQEIRIHVSKKQVLYIHAHQSLHTHASHVHTHDTMYAHVYTCTHCDCTGHLTKFCYNKIRALKFASKNVWVRKGANPHDPIRYGYQNSPLLYLM